MKKMFLLGCIGILAASTAMVSCDKNGDELDEKTKTTTTNGTQDDKYVWSTDGGINACNHVLFADNTLPNKDDAKDHMGTQIGNGEQEFVFKGKQTLKKGTYTLKGWVYVADGSVLTIEPGTIVKGDKETKAAIIVERGGKLIAKGTPDAPIVFTSANEPGNRRPGDWGGIILCGKARNNARQMQIEGGPRTNHGGNDDHDNSGVLQYVRIEFAGYPFHQDQEINGLTFGSVGDGTTIDHVQVSYSNDDSYEWFGGTVQCKYMIAYKSWDDDFDTDNGFSGKVQFGLAIRDSRIADGSKSNSFESDNNATGSDVTPYTKAVFSNMTFIGPKYTDPNFENTVNYINGGKVNPKNGSSLGVFQSAMHIRRNSRLNCFNSVAVGYPIGIILDAEKPSKKTGTGTQAIASQGLMTLQNIIFAGMTVTGSDFNGVYQDHLYDYIAKKTDDTKPSFSSSWFVKQTGNKVLDDMSAVGLTTTAPFMPKASSMLLSGASFTSPLLSTWFDQVKFIGAFGTTDWTKGWTNFDPENTKY